jgi:hypothetical protein
MPDTANKSIEDWFLEQYRDLVARVHPTFTAAWPVLSGHNRIVGTIGDDIVLILIHTGVSTMTSTRGLGKIDPTIAGGASISDDTRELIRANLARHFRLTPSDGVIFVTQTQVGGGGVARRELQQLLMKHEIVMGLAPVKIFLRGRFEIGCQACNSSNNVLASFRSRVSNPSVNHP